MPTVNEGNEIVLDVLLNADVVKVLQDNIALILGYRPQTGQVVCTLKNSAGEIVGQGAHHWTEVAISEALIALGEWNG